MDTSLLEWLQLANIQDEDKIVNEFFKHNIFTVYQLSQSINVQQLAKENMSVLSKKRFDKALSLFSVDCLTVDATESQDLQMDSDVLKSISDESTDQPTNHEDCADVDPILLTELTASIICLQKQLELVSCCIEVVNRLLVGETGDDQQPSIALHPAVRSKLLLSKHAHQERAIRLTVLMAAREGEMLGAASQGDGLSGAAVGITSKDKRLRVSFAGIDELQQRTEQQAKDIHNRQQLGTVHFQAFGGESSLLFFIQNSLA
jgi:hypothetical protein